MELVMMERLRIYEQLLAVEVGRGLGGNESGQLWERHIADSLTLLPSLDQSIGAWIADIGSGYGLPGIPLAIALPGSPVSLIEPRSSRTRFLRAAIDDLGLTNAEVLPVRWRSAPLRPIDVALARALAPPAETAQIIAAGQPVERSLILAVVDNEPTVIDSWHTSR